MDTLCQEYDAQRAQGITGIQLIHVDEVENKNDNVLEPSFHTLEECRGMNARAEGLRGVGDLDYMINMMVTIPNGMVVGLLPPVSLDPTTNHILAVISVERRVVPLSSIVNA
jgi:hypothetical protein